MIESLAFKTRNNNSYIYDDQLRLTLLVHPEFLKIFKNDTTEISDSHYKEKYDYLKYHGFFSVPKVAEFGTLNEAMVKNSLVHTQQIVFEVTDFCNLDCTYCAYGNMYQGFEERNFKNINEEYAVNLLKYIFEHKPKCKGRKLYIGFYGGEPLYNGTFVKKIVELSQMLNQEKEMTIEYSMTTNATLIHKYIDLLVDNKFRLLVSLDGNEKNHGYRVFRGNRKNSHATVIRNLDFLQEKYPDYFVNFVDFNAVLHDRNSVQEIYEFIYSRYKKIPRIAELSFDDLNPEKKDQYEKMFQSKRDSEVQCLDHYSDISYNAHTESIPFKELTNFLKFYTVNYYVSNIKSLFQKNERNLPTCTCLPGQKKIMMTTRNKLLPCEKINYKFSIGNVGDDVYINIAEITKKYKFYFDHIAKVCKHCYAYRFCSTCLFQLEQIETVDSDKFSCEFFSDSGNFRYKLSSTFSFLENNTEDYYNIVENLILE